MRKRTIIYGMAALTFAGTGCAAVQEMEAPRTAPSASFEVYASPSDTRTVNDGMSTLWVSGDRFNLFHAPAGTPSFTSDGAFTVDEPSTGHASGSVGELAEGEYDWYMVYPYDEAAGKPTSVPVLIGAALDGVQVQTGKDSPAHLCGEGFPVGGKARQVPGTETPVLAASPLVSVLAVKVTNPGAGSVKVSSVSFQAPEAIAGTFRVDVTGQTPLFKEDEATDEATLSVEGDATLHAGETAVFYLGIKPFHADAGSTLTLRVNQQVRTVTLSKATDFASGKIKALNITLDPVGQDPLYYYKRVESVTPGRKYIFVAEDTRQGGLRMAWPLPADVESGQMAGVTVTEAEEGVIALDHTDAVFTFTESDDRYTIRQADGRYLYSMDKNLVYASTEPGSYRYWTLSFDADGLASIVNRSRQFQYNTSSSVQKFELRTVSATSSIGRNPWLYELQNDDAATGEFLERTVPGVYDYKGASWLYEDGTSQISIRTLSGSLTFRLFFPADFTVVQLTGLPADPAVNGRYPVRMVRYVKQAATHADDFTVTVAKVEDGKAWLMADGGTGFIVSIQ